MAFPNIFTKEEADKLINRVNSLTKDTQPLWGKMNVAQMLAHSNVTFRYVYEPEAFKKPKFPMTWVLKAFVKPQVINEKPYPKNGPTGPDFLIKGERDFEAEKEKMVGFIKRIQAEGVSGFDQRESFSFGKLSSEEWNNMFYKHLDHHLRQFGV